MVSSSSGFRVLRTLGFLLGLSSEIGVSRVGVLEILGFRESVVCVQAAKRSGITFQAGSYMLQLGPKIRV